jgi:hypothetical protein
MDDRLKQKVAKGVSHFWRTRDIQTAQQGKRTGMRDYGARSAVTGGRQLDGFITLIRELLVDAGLEGHSIFARGRHVVLPGYFRPTKEWDLLVIADGNLLATIEFQSQVGPSFGNNFNNRTEEALGSATDLWTAYREGAFQDSVRPWLGYFMLLEESKGSTSAVRTSSPHFEVFPEFANASYAERYEVFCIRLVRERLYDSACLLLSDRKTGKRGRYQEPNSEISFSHFAASLTGHVTAYVRLRQQL